MKYFIVNEEKDKVYNLTKLIPEFMSVENKTEQEAIDYFMSGLDGTRYMKFPNYTRMSTICEWIIYDKIYKED